jgi:hypothetical protein
MALTRRPGCGRARHSVNVVAPSLAAHPFLAKVTSEELLAELTGREGLGRAAHRCGNSAGNSAGQTTWTSPGRRLSVQAVVNNASVLSWRAQPGQAHFAYLTAKYLR